MPAEDADWQLETVDGDSMEMCTTNKHPPSFSDKWRSTEWTTIEPLRIFADLLEIFLPSFPFAIMQWTESSVDLPQFSLPRQSNVIILPL